jgi:hypothetical protein
VVFCTPWANTRKVGSRDRGAVELPGVRQRADDETPRTTNVGVVIPPSPFLADKWNG